MKKKSGDSDAPRWKRLFQSACIWGACLVFLSAGFRMSGLAWHSANRAAFVYLFAWMLFTWGMKGRAASFDELMHDGNDAGFPKLMCIILFVLFGNFLIGMSSMTPWERADPGSLAHLAQLALPAMCLVPFFLEYWLPTPPPPP